MNNDIVQLTDNNGNNVFPIAGAATQDSISKSMLEEGVFEGTELFPAPSEAYVRTENIVDGAVTSDKIDSATYSTERKAVGTWMDGRTIYRKTVHITSPSTSNAYYGVVDDDLTQGLYITGYMNASSGAEDYTIPVPQTDSSSTYSVILFVGKQLRGRFAFSSGVPSDVWVNAYYLIDPAP